MFDFTGRQSIEYVLVERKMFGIDKQYLDMSGVFVTQTYFKSRVMVLTYHNGMLWHSQSMKVKQAEEYIRRMELVEL